MYYKSNSIMRYCEINASNYEADDKEVDATDYTFMLSVDENGYFEVKEQHKGHTLGCFLTEPAESWYGRFESFFLALQAIKRDYKYIW